LFNEGQDHHERGDLTKAIELYKKALELISEFPEAELQLGNAYRSIGRSDEAESAFRRALELRDDWSLAMTTLGSFLFAKDQFVEADILLTEAIKLDPQNFPAWAAIVELRLATGSSEVELKNLLIDITRLAAGTRIPAMLWTAKSALERSLGDHRSAAASAERALALEPNNVTAISELAEIRLAEGDPEGAEGYIRKIESLSPNSHSKRSLRVRLHIARDEPEEAIRLLEADKEKTLEDLELLERLRIVTSLDVTGLESKLESGEDTTILSRLCSLNRASDPIKALSFCLRARKAEPNNLSHSIGYVAALLQAKHFNEAISELRKLTEIAPENSTVRANLGLALFQTRRYTEAKQEFRNLLDRQPDLVVAYYFLAICHDNLSELMDAMANYQEFIRRADPVKHRDEIERVNLRLPILDRQLKQRK
jgi:tetratricopeptide (TPR) repeat protein